MAVQEVTCADWLNLNVDKGKRTAELDVIISNYGKYNSDKRRREKKGQAYNQRVSYRDNRKNLEYYESLIDSGIKTYSIFHLF